MRFYRAKQHVPQHILDAGDVVAEAMGMERRDVFRGYRTAKVLEMADRIRAAAALEGLSVSEWLASGASLADVLEG